MANSMDERTFACQKPNVHGCVEKNTSPLLDPCSLALLRGKSALASQIHPLARGDGVDILVAAARQVAQDDRVLRHVARQLAGLGDGVAGLERGEAAFGICQQVEIGRANVCTPVTTAHLVCSHLLEQQYPTVEAE